MTPVIKKETRSISFLSNINQAQLMHEDKCFNYLEYNYLLVDCLKK